MSVRVQRAARSRSVGPDEALGFTWSRMREWARARAPIRVCAIADERVEARLLQRLAPAKRKAVAAVEFCSLNHKHHASITHTDCRATLRSTHRMRERGLALRRDARPRAHDVM
jgi:hypothetical protein